MKKFFMILVMAAMTAGTYAQDDMTLDEGMSELSSKKYTVVTNGFWTNWFVEANATMPKFDKVGMSFALGKWFSPSIGVRTKFNAFRAKAVEEQVMFNLSTILCGYNAKRVYNFIPYLGGGMSLGSPSLLGVSAGVVNKFRLSKRLDLNLDINYRGSEHYGNITDAVVLKTKHDHSMNIELGFTLNIGRTKWKKEPDIQGIQEMYQMEIDALKATIEDMENNR